VEAEAVPVVVARMAPGAAQVAREAEQVEEPAERPAAERVEAQGEEPAPATALPARAVPGKSVRAEARVRP
jgi:hypothetical protein